MVQQTYRDLKYWDEFIAMLSGGALGLGFLFYGVSADQLIQKAIGAIGGAGFGGAAIFYSKKVRDREFYLSCIEETDRQIFIESCNSTLEEFIAPPAPEPPPEAPMIAPALPVAGVRIETPEQQWKRCECPEGAAKDSRKKQLWDYTSHHHPEIIMLLERLVILGYGEMGSGKSTFMAFLGLLRYLFLGHDLKVCDPHGHLNEDKWCTPVFDLHGAGMDYKAIGGQLDEYLGRIKAGRLTNPLTSIWDEVTNYQERVPGGDREFLKSMLSDPRKIGEFIIIMAHGDTLASLGGSKGTAKMRDRGMTKILFLGEADARGNVRPAGRGTIFGLFKNDKGEPMETPITIREWMNPQYIVSIFPELKEVSNMQKRIMGSLEKSPELEDEPQLRNETASTDAQRLETLIQQAQGDSTLSEINDENWKTADVDKPLSVETKAVIVACIRAGLSQNKTIAKVFGLQPSGKSARYEKAREIFQSFKTLLGDD